MADIIGWVIETGLVGTVVYWIVRGLKQKIRALEGTLEAQKGTFEALDKTLKAQSETIEAVGRRAEEFERIAEWYKDRMRSFDQELDNIVKLKDTVLVTSVEAVKAEHEAEMRRIKAAQPKPLPPHAPADHTKLMELGPGMEQALKGLREAVQNLPDHLKP